MTGAWRYTTLSDCVTRVWRWYDRVGPAEAVTRIVGPCARAGVLAPLLAVPGAAVLPGYGTHARPAIVQPWGGDAGGFDEVADAGFGGALGGGGGSLLGSFAVGPQGPRGITSLQGPRAFPLPSPGLMEQPSVEVPDAPANPGIPVYLVHETQAQAIPEPGAWVVVPALVVALVLRRGRG